MIDPNGMEAETIYEEEGTGNKVEVKDGINKTIEVNKIDFAKAKEFAENTAGDGETIPIVSEEYEQEYKDFYNSVNSYDELSVENAYDYFFNEPDLQSTDDFKPEGGTIPLVGGPAKTVATKTSGWIARSIFKKLDKSVQKRMINAIKKGIVAPTNNSGIIKLTASQAKKYPGYTHKLKILGKGSDIRIYGTQGKNGHFFFNKVGKH